jgi:hypothetical protein
MSQGILLNVSAKADKTAPTVKSSSLKNNAAGVVTKVKIVIKYSENIFKGKNFTKIKLTRSSKAVKLKLVISKTTLSITPSAPLSYYTNYVLVIPTSAIKDKAGNVIKKSTTIKFKTKAKITSLPGKTYKVGKDIPAGEYLITEDEFGFTDWHVFSNPVAPLNTIITSGFKQTYITVDAGTYLNVQMGTLYPIATAPILEPIDGKYLAGYYKVGRDIPAGEYDIIEVEGPDISMFEICKDSYCQFESIVDIDVVIGTQHVTVTDGQYLHFVDAYIAAAVPD